MDILISPVVLAVAFGVIYIVLPLVIHALYYTHTRVVTCPKTTGLAEVKVDAGGRSKMTVRNCSLWREVRGCGAECMKS